MISAGRQHGFTLLEVLVAFALLAGSVGMLLAIVSGGVRQVRASAQATEAAAVAQSLIASLGIAEPLVEGETAGESDDGRYRWLLQIQEVEQAQSVFPLQLEASEGDPEAEFPGSDPFVDPEGAPIDDPGAAAMFRIDLELAWGKAGENATTARFSTLRLWSRQLP